MNLSFVFKRIMGFIMDLIVLYFCSICFMTILKIPWSKVTIMMGAGFSSLLYFPLFWLATKGKTIGGMLVGIRLVPDGSNVLTFKACIIRALILLPLIFPYGLVSVLSLLNIIESLILFNKDSNKDVLKATWDIASKTKIIFL